MITKLLHLLRNLFGSANAEVAVAHDREVANAEVEVNKESKLDEAFESGGSVVPYDENLLEKARTQWQFGDWESLASLDRDTLQHHPDRAKLVLLAAAGRLQVGQDAEARQYIRLAQDWGCSKQLIGQILISGVHNSIGMAAAISGLDQRAMQHFNKSIVIGTPSGDIKLLSQARIAQQFNQLNQLGLVIPANLVDIPSSAMAKNNDKTQSIIENFSTITHVLKEQKYDFDLQLKQQAKELNRVRDSLSRVIKTEVTNATKQLEAFFGIQNYFESGQFTGELHGWPISPDLGLYLIQQIETKAYDLVLEFGSGTSTQIIAKALAVIEKRQPSRTKPIQVSFEHIEQYYKKTQLMLQQSGLIEAVDLYHTPLQPYTTLNGDTYSYYDCEPVLKKLATKLDRKKSVAILALVDGPPKSTGPNARYPALPLLVQHFKNTEIDIILDDYNRQEEKDVAKKWLNDLITQNIPYEQIEEDLDKGAFKLSIFKKN